MLELGDKNFKIVVIGAGPAGLTATHFCRQQGYKTLLLELGKAIGDRENENPNDLVTGVGGAGLWSDGKFSFFPSATGLWTLEDRRHLRDAYGRASQILRQFGMKNPPAFPEGTEREPSELSDGSRIKRYPSFRLPLEQRTAMIQFLQSAADSSLITGCRVTSIEPSGSSFQVTFLHKEAEHTVLANAVILACGRLGSMQVKSVAPEIPLVFRRYEIGVRIEQNAACFVIQDENNLDPKHLFQKDGKSYSWRTFCNCKNGQIVETDFLGLRTLSGRGDGIATEVSNVGFNLRLDEASLTSGIQTELDALLQGKVARFDFSLADFISGKRGAYGDNLDGLLREGLLLLFKDSAIPDANISGPCIEGVGFYPSTDDNLQVPGMQIWVAGDQTGIFRGLTAALVSGYYAAIQACNYLQLTKSGLIHLKVGPTQPMPIIFTAQSKVFFYCRDAVCEYVLKQGYLPVNPFRVFEYFLGDRVERDLVRRGNNQLIKTADEIWVFGPIADGVLFEIALGRKLGKPVRFFNIDNRSSGIHSIPHDELKFEPEVHNRGILKEDLLAFVFGNIKQGTEPQHVQDHFLF